jgi:hypothetical protein
MRPPHSSDATPRELSEYAEIEYAGYGQGRGFVRRVYWLLGPDLSIRMS